MFNGCRVLNAATVHHARQTRRDQIQMSEATLLRRPNELHRRVGNLQEIQNIVYINPVGRRLRVNNLSESKKKKIKYPHKIIIISRELLVSNWWS